MSEMSSTGLEVVEDVKPTRKRQISFSSDDSEPIPKHLRCDVSDSSDDENSCTRDCAYLLQPTATEQEEGDDVTEVLPLDQVSEAPILVVTSLSEKEASLVAEVASDVYVTDVGTRIALVNGRYVGTVSAVFGPVSHPFCVVFTKNKTAFSELVGSEALKIGVGLHYDLLHHQIIYSPETQCDATAGTDASYLNDEELPDNVRPEFSDDEEERLWSQKNNGNDTNEQCRSESTAHPSVVTPSWLL